MRRCCLLLALLGLLLVTGCRKDGDEATRRLTIYSPHGTELLTEFKDRFEAQHPDVEVVFLDMGSQQVLDRIRSERMNPQADLWWGAPQDLFMSAAREGLLEPYRPSWADAIDESERDPQFCWTGTFLTPQVILYNRVKLASEEVPDDWDDLLDERWRGRITIRYPMASGGMRGMFGALIERERVKGDDAGLRWLARLDANTQSYPTSPALMFEELTRGDAVLSIWNLPDVVLQQKTYERPFGYVIPKSGTLVITDGIALVKGGKNLDLARSFYEFVTSPESLILQAEKFHRIPCRNDIPPESLPEWMRHLEINPMPMDWRQLSENSDRWMREWDSRIKNRGRKWLLDHPL
ncbi:extracellular solute-binding protein [bacterium]|nr:extracellular solute-binding protein [bacterium]